MKTWQNFTVNINNQFYFLNVDVIFTERRSWFFAKSTNMHVSWMRETNNLCRYGQFVRLLDSRLKNS